MEQAKPLMPSEVPEFMAPHILFDTQTIHKECLWTSYKCCLCGELLKQRTSWLRTRLQEPNFTGKCKRCMLRKFLVPEEVPGEYHGNFDFQSQYKRDAAGFIQCTCSKCSQLVQRKITDIRKTITRGGKVTALCGECSRSEGLHQTNIRRYKDNIDPNKGHNARGYVVLYRPGYQSADKRGYILEHRMVMEEMLGRKLTPTENVHHKNHIRHDNQPENLELWVTKQPNGGRVRDIYLDLVRKALIAEGADSVFIDKIAIRLAGVPESCL